MRPCPVSPAAARPSGRWLLLASLGVVLAQGPAPLARAASQTVTGPLNLSAAVDLRFSIAIDKFMFLRIGDGAWPTPGGTVSTASFVVNPSIPAAPTTPNRSGSSVAWERHESCQASSAAAEASWMSRDITLMLLRG